MFIAGEIRGFAIPSLIAEGTVSLLSSKLLSSLSSSVFALGVNLLYSVLSTYILYLPHSSLFRS